MKKTGNWTYVAISSCIGIAVSASSFHWGLLLFFSIYVLWIFFLLERKILGIVVILSAIGFCSYISVMDYLNTSKHSSIDQSFYAQITEPVNRDGNKITFQIKSQEKEKILVEYFMENQDEIAFFSSLQTGDHCHLNGNLTPPSSPTNPHAFNYPKYLFHQHIHWTLSLTNTPTNCLSPPKSNLFHSLKQSRKNGIDATKYQFEQPISGFMISLIFGDRTYMQQDILDSYQLLGLVHLLAISGLHVGVITTAVFYLGIRVGFTRQFMNVSLILLLPIYVVVAGSAPSVMRAALMTAAVLIYQAVKKRFLSIDVIGIACLVILIINPYYLFHIGFQLSFIVSLALLLSMKKISVIQNKTYQLFIVSSIAQIASLPILLFHFYQVSLWSPFLNILFVPFFSLFVLPFSFVLFFCMLVSPALLPLLLPLLEYPLVFMNSLAVRIADFPFGTLVFGKPSVWLVAAYASAIVFLFYAVEVYSKRKLIQAIVCFLICCIFHWNGGYFDSKGKVVVIDIGQGDAIFIQLPFRKGIYLIDTGGVFRFQEEEWKKRRSEFDGGEKILVPFLKAEGVRRMDKLILTHGDYDHIGNVSSVLRHIKVKDTYIPIGFGKGTLEQEIIMELEKRKVQVTMVGTYSGWAVGNNTFQFLHPSKVYEDKNDGSIVLYAELGGLTWLFTGDIEEAGERDLLTLYPNLKADVLKAAHHGSRSSTLDPFVEQIRPTYALISAGRDNRFGHPHTEVVERLKGAGAVIYRTDQQGAILYIFTERGGTFSTVLP